MKPHFDDTAGKAKKPAPDKTDEAVRKIDEAMEELMRQHGGDPKKPFKSWFPT